MDPTTIRLDSVSKGFNSGKSRTEVLRDIDMTFELGEFVSIIGPSGCGKSTVFNILAGLDRPDSGRVLMSDLEITNADDCFAYMPQKDLMMPWLRVIDNAALGLRIAGVRRNEARERAAELFDAFGLKGFEHHWPSQLSGGMRQRVALLRTVLLNRPVLLLDEPFGALDSLTRTDMQAWLLSMWEQFKWTVLLITHDIREAVLLSDSIYCFTARPARIEGVYRVNLPRPRTVEMFADAEAIALESALHRALDPNRYLGVTHDARP